MKNVKISQMGSALSITKADSSFQMIISLRKKFIANSDNCHFFLKQRNGKQKIALQSHVHALTNRNIQFKVHVNPPISLLLKTEKQIWDLYVEATDQQTENLTSRIKITKEELPFVTILIDRQTKMFYPYRTTHGNLSFVLSYTNVRAAIANVSITKQHISMKGCFHIPTLAKSSSNNLMKARLIVTNNFDNGNAQIPLHEFVQRKDDRTMFDFTCNVDLYKRLYQNTKLFFKFYLEIELETNGRRDTLRSERLQWMQAKKKTMRKKQFDYADENFKGKLKIAARPTKKAKYLSVTISTYDWKNGMIEAAKQKIIKTRRSKWVLQIYKQLFAFIGLLPKKNIIIFESFHGKQFSCNPRAIYEYAKKSHLNYRMYWSVDKRHAHQFTNLNIQTVQRFTLKWLFLMPQAKYWITNSRLPLWLPKPKKTIYVQTWHGTPLKKLAADMEEVHMPATNADKYIANFLKEAKKWDYLISPNAYSTEIFRRAFGFEKKIIESGYPRNDFLIHNNRKEVIDQIKQKFSLPLNKKIILYAPTWRDNHYYAKGKYKFDIPLNLERLKQELHEQYILLCRLHYLVAEKLSFSNHENFMFDFSNHEDIRELYLISDLLITDYSSVFFDYANLKRPILFYVYDLEEYRDKLRGFYFDFEKQAPGPLVKTTDQLIAEIKKIDSGNDQPAKDFEAFFKTFCSLEDGHACERVANEIFHR